MRDPSLHVSGEMALSGWFLVYCVSTSKKDLILGPSSSSGHTYDARTVSMMVSMPSSLLEVAVCR